MHFFPGILPAFLLSDLGESGRQSTTHMTPLMPQSEQHSGTTILSRPGPLEVQLSKKTGWDLHLQVCRQISALLVTIQKQDPILPPVPVCICIYKGSRILRKSLMTSVVTLLLQLLRVLNTVDIHPAVDALRISAFELTVICTAG